MHFFPATAMMTGVKKKKGIYAATLCVLLMTCAFVLGKPLLAYSVRKIALEGVSELSFGSLRFSKGRWEVRNVHFATEQLSAEIERLSLPFNGKGGITLYRPTIGIRTLSASRLKSKNSRPIEIIEGRIGLLGEEQWAHINYSKGMAKLQLDHFVLDTLGEHFSRDVGQFRGEISGRIEVAPDRYTVDVSAGGVSWEHRAAGLKAKIDSVRLVDTILKNPENFWHAYFPSGEIRGLNLFYKTDQIIHSLEGEIGERVGLKGNWCGETARIEGGRDRFNLRLGQMRSEVILGDESVHTSIRQMDRKQLDILYHILATFFPELKEYGVEGHSLSMEMEAAFDSEGVHNIEMEEILARDLKVKGRTWEGGCERMGGNVYIDCRNMTIFHAPTWGVKIHGGALTTEWGAIDNVVLDFAMHEGFIIPSTFACGYKGYPIHIDMKGRLSHVKADGNFAGIPFGMGLKKKVRGYVLQGEAADTVHYSAFYDAERGLHDGMVVASEMDLTALNVPLDLFGQSWRLRGNADVSGAFDMGELSLEVHSSNAEFLSKHVDLKLQANQTFHIDYQVGERRWAGQIPIAKAVCLEKRFGHTYSDISGEIEIFDQVLRMQGIRAQAHDLTFQGDLSLEFLPDDKAHFAIRTDQIKGEFGKFQEFMRHFEDFEDLDVPLKGEMVSGASGLEFEVTIGEAAPPLWEMSLAIYDGTYAVTNNVSLQHLDFELRRTSQNGIHFVTDLSGELLFADEQYKLIGPKLIYDETGPLDFDLMMQTKTHDVGHVVGHSDGKALSIDIEKSHFYGAKFQSFRHTPELLDCTIELPLSQLFHQIAFLKQAGLVNVNLDLAKMRGEGTLTAHILKEGDEVSIKGESFYPKINQKKFAHALCHVEKKGREWRLVEGKLDDLRLSGVAIDEGERFWIPELNAKYKRSRLSFEKGSLTGSVLSMPLREGIFALEEWHSNPYLLGNVHGTGLIEVDVREGSLDGSLSLYSEDFGRGNIQIETPEPFAFHLSKREGLRVEGAHIKGLYARERLCFADCTIGSLTLDEEVVGKDIHLTLPPEMCIFLAETGSIPHLTYENEKLVLLGKPIKWENQIEGDFDFEYDDEFKLSGKIKDGYYWFGDKSWRLADFNIGYARDTLIASFVCDLWNLPLAISTEVTFDKQIRARLTLEDGREGLEKPLTLSGTFDREKGPSVQKIEGDIWGLNFGFHHNGKGSLSGSMKVNVPKLFPILPEKLAQKLYALGIGNGYEFAGDLGIFPRPNFNGYFKAKDFFLFGAQMDNLMANFKADLKSLCLSDFQIIDEAGSIHCAEIKLEEEEGDWTLKMPTFTVKDFRPSALKKLGESNRKKKPFVIEELLLSGVTGKLSDPSSFIGHGNLVFLNTFKKETHLLDIPFELIARLGLDTKLLVPVKGEFTYEMRHGKIYLTDLRGAHSEGKRSKFYLSNSRPSYIDFSGDIDISIKMKQYVILKVTEPFILSIQGTVAKPKYGLR